eukprot:8203484-Pyramimonas_sp.AAC.1
MARGANGLVAAGHASTRSSARVLCRTAQREAGERTSAHLQQRGFDITRCLRGDSRCTAEGSGRVL